MIQPWQYPVLFVAGFAAGFVDSVAGGGGLITVPVLLNLGFNPVDALGTNKLQASFGSGSATWHYARASLIDFQDLRAGILFTAIGAAAGTSLVQRLDESFLRHSIPVLLIAIAVYTLLQPRIGEADVHPRCRRSFFYPAAGLALGFYDGFFGPGTGSFWAMAFMLGLGFNLSRATAATKVMNFTSNLVSLAVFWRMSDVHLGAGFTMGAGQLFGARVGAGMVIRRGARFVRPVMVTMAVALTVKLLWR